MATSSSKKRTTNSRSTSTSSAKGTTKRGSSGSGKRKTSTKGRGKTQQKAEVPAYFDEILVLVVLAISVLLFLSNFKLCGVVGEVLKNVTLGAFGIFGYVIPILLMLATCFYIVNREHPAVIPKLLEAAALLVVICGFTQLMVTSGTPESLEWKAIHEYAMTGKGGGVVGGALVKLLYPLFGKVGSVIIHILLFLVCLILLTHISIIRMLDKQSKRIAAQAGQNMEHRRRVQEVRSQEKEVRRQERLEQSQRDLQERQERSERQLEQMRQLNLARQALEQGGQNVEPEIETSTTSRGNRVENPVRGLFDTKEQSAVREKKPSFTITQYGKTQNASAEVSVTPTEPMNDDTYLIDDIIRRELEETETSAATPVRSKFPTSEASIPRATMGAPEQSEIVEKHPRSKQERLAEIKRSGMNADGTKTIVTSNGKVITMEMDMGSEKRVVAEKKDEEDVIVPVEKKTAPPKEYIFPPLHLLKRGANIQKDRDQELRDNAMKLEQTLQSFGVRVSVVNVSCGPAVTRYELQPEQGVKVSRIVSLQDDIKLNLAAADIRIEAPIPGKAAIGIEIPNKESSMVMLRDLLESPEFTSHSSKLVFGAGKDIGGQTIVADVAKMPHLLIAGATGSGKSVCINTIIMSILYKAKPSEVKLIMIDPKVVELSVYNGIPHLLIPVVTDARKAAGALNWAVAEMNQRYKKFADLAVRDLKGYNEKLLELYKGPEEQRPTPLPQIVIIVDELADLMMVAPNEVEDAIQHLTQMARAAGLHLILATQRPSVNVITGVIKANVPSRIAFSVSSGVDSRTILDMVGAEKLLGKGDMLYHPFGMQKPMRVQGAFVSDQEVSSVVDFLAKQDNVVGASNEEAQRIQEQIAGASVEENQSGTTDKEEENRSDIDPLFREAGILIVGKEKASISMLQRAFRIGFNRAARIVDQLTESGVISEEEGTKPRKVLMTEAEFEVYCEEAGVN